MVEPHELPAVGCRAEGLLKLVHLATLRVTRQVSAHASAIAYTGERLATIIWPDSRLETVVKFL